jgi:signal transduction histidine kinase
MTQRQHNLLLFKTSSPILISGDATRLVQIVVNLLINAAKFTDNGGRIWLILEHDANWARIKVRDTGIGIAPELLSTIFDSYVQADAGRSRSGSGLGLGLALAQQLARLHGGALSAHSDGIGHGSEFVLQLPRARD